MNHVGRSPIMHFFVSELHLFTIIFFSRTIWLSLVPIRLSLDSSETLNIFFNFIYLLKYSFTLTWGPGAFNKLKSWNQFSFIPLFENTLTKRKNVGNCYLLWNTISEVLIKSTDKVAYHTILYVLKINDKTINNGKKNIKVTSF